MPNVNTAMKPRSESMIKLQRLGHVLMAVRDLERSKKFYIDLLGFKLLEQDPEHGGVFLAIGGHGNTLDLFPSTAPDAGPPSASDGRSMPGLGVKHIAFAVEGEDDLRAAYHALTEAGVMIQRALDHESQKSIYFHDPDGNLLEIVWERPDALDIFAKGRGDNDAELQFNR
jgi:catechol 2,3-dioxygenase-like lactoylglutathione lyase family enzyme